MIQENNDDLEWSEYGRIPGVTMIGTVLCMAVAAICAFCLAIAAYLEI